MAILVDTSAWFARFVADDPAHARVAKWFAENDKPLITTDYCIDEVLTPCIARKRPLLAVEAGRLLFDESVAQLHFLTAEPIQRSWIVFQQRAAAGWSFTDCTSKTAIEQLKITEAVTLDRHFEQFGVTILP